MKDAHELDELGQQDSPVMPLEKTESMLAGLARIFFAPVSSIPGNAADGFHELPVSAGSELDLRYRTLLEQIPAVVFMARLEDGQSEAYVNPHIETILGFSREQWLDDPIRWYHQIHPDDRSRWNVEAASFVLSGEPLRSVYRVLARDGHVVWFQCDVKMVRRADGQPWFLHGVAFDITELKNAEQELKGASDELEKRVRERTAALESEIVERERAERNLARRAEDLARSNADLEQFAYSASHDLQEPIRNIVISAQLLGLEHAEGLDPKGDALLKTVIASARHMESLVRDLLEYTHVARAAEETESAADANQVLKEVLQSLETIIRNNAAEITCDSLPSVKLPAFLLHQLFQNLISNAIKYKSNQPPRIQVSAALVEGSWLFSVQDNGIGIDPKYHGGIFGIFKRLHSRDQYPGTGIGLAICKRIVEHAGGQIWVESESGKGARFLFTIPNRH